MVIKGRCSVWLRCLIALGVVCLSPDRLPAQGNEDVEAKTFDDLSFRAIGPAVMGGRIDAVEVVEGMPWVLYLGTASGGIFKSVNNGTTWTAVFESEATSSIGDVAVAPSDRNIVWVGTGEPNNRQSSSTGNGVYVSEDGGRSWTHAGLSETQHIGKVIVHPSDPHRVFVAALGGLWSSNEGRGVFRTRDGGKTWEKTLYVNEDTGVVTLAMDPVNPDVLYAASYQRRRVPWGFDGGGEGSDIYKTTDGGDTWKRLEEGLPEGPKGRIGLAIFRGDPNLVYALIEHRSEGGLYRSYDRGESFTRVNELNPRPMYYSHLFVDPTDPDRIYVLGSSFHVSEDGGKSFTVNRQMTPTYDIGVHGDHHDLWIDPKNPEHMILGGDGGLYFTWDQGAHWDKVNNLAIAQFYDIAVDMEEPYNVYGGAQDTHSWGGPSATHHQIGILNGDWVQINFGDGMYQAVDPTDPTIVYTESQGGNLIRFDRRTGNRKVIKPHPEEDEQEYRFHWTSPLVVSSHDPSVLYFGGNRLFVSEDRGESWTASADLTRNEDRDELPIMEAVPDENTLSKHDGVADWGTITSISESPLKPGLLYVGTDDGRIQISQDGGESWEAVEENLPGLDPARAKVSRVVASHAREGRAYLSFDRHHLGDFAPYVFVTEDYGKSWRPLASDLPSRGWVNVVVEHPGNANLLFVGTETGLCVSFDRGETWLRMSGGFPTVPVDDLMIHPRDNDLVVGTHGRSIYILDDVTPLEKYRPGGGHQLFEPRPARLFLPWKHESYGAQRQFVGENPPYGALVTYFLSRPVDAGASLTIEDASGKTLRQLEGASGEGFQRVVWDLRSEGPEEVEDGRGALVPPGRYRIELRAGDESQETWVELELDPRTMVSADEFRERFRFLEEVNGLRSRLGRVVSAGEAFEEDLQQWSRVFSGEIHASVRNALEELSQKLVEARRDIGGARRSFRNPSLLARASRVFGELAGDDVRQGTLAGPTPVQRMRLERLRREADDAVGALRSLVSGSIEEVNRELERISPLRLENPFP